VTSTRLYPFTGVASGISGIRNAGLRFVYSAGRLAAIAGLLSERDMVERFMLDRLARRSPWLAMDRCRRLTLPLCQREREG